jgi:hypothetical protein
MIILLTNFLGISHAIQKSSFLKVGGMLKMILVCHLLALGLITCLLVQCPAREFVGITLGYDQQSVFPSKNAIKYSAILFRP